MTDDVWRPLGVDTEEQVAEYDALHDGVPTWMDAAYWTWVRDVLTVREYTSTGRNQVDMLNVSLAEKMCQMLRIPLPSLRKSYADYSVGQDQLNRAIQALRGHSLPLQIADYLLAHGGKVPSDNLDSLLERSRSAYRVGVRAGRPGLSRRVPEGVQVAAESVMVRAGKAGVRLSSAWGELYGVNSNASAAYRLAILAVEDAAIPVVSPSNKSATLGTVIKQIEDQKDWRLPMDREHGKAPSSDVVIATLKMLWHGQHDRHGGQPFAPGNVSFAEAQVAVSLAVVLVQWFDAGLIQRLPKNSGGAGS
ncbi:hypothetical protein MUY14_36580 [Amycolatopsis sp. FBCC-B4732]|uniref:hypothetical protein n=1 Tax=Amycolatopsis sp. FBCC-B4732 TaxID=3079339 RepID=UPI001FF20D7D|nr:hypothetical protein [Amycolatopsis sp. FBCC-B4732]UOX87198.1 hypothetical protein MUY14_36580 [Amycolatopsis sp. FBCC-B4732]